MDPRLISADVTSQIENNIVFYFITMAAVIITAKLKAHNVFHVCMFISSSYRQLLKVKTANKKKTSELQSYSS